MTQRDEIPPDGAQPNDADHLSASRRSVLLGAGALGVGAMGAAAVLAACSSGTPAGPQAPTTGAPSPTGPPPPITTAEIPVGGGKIFKDTNLVVTQPTAGTFKAFSATCQHLGCQVGSIADGKITCPCHGSQYNIADGSVARGPSERGLIAKSVTVTGDTIVVT